jgi:hypothetical protein
MCTCTYVVKHKSPTLAVNADTTINGGKLQSVMFDDALLKLEKAEDLITELKIKTSCSNTLKLILDYEDKN